MADHGRRPGREGAGRGASGAGPGGKADRTRDERGGRTRRQFHVGAGADERGATSCRCGHRGVGERSANLDRAGHGEECSHRGAAAIPEGRPDRACARCRSDGRPVAADGRGRRRESLAHFAACAGRGARHRGFRDGRDAGRRYLAAGHAGSSAAGAVRHHGGCATAGLSKCAEPSHAAHSGGRFDGCGQRGGRGLGAGAALPDARRRARADSGRSADAGCEGRAAWNAGRLHGAGIGAAGADRGEGSGHGTRTRALARSGAVPRHGRGRAAGSVGASGSARRDSRLDHEGAARCKHAARQHDGLDAAGRRAGAA